MCRSCFGLGAMCISQYARLLLCFDCLDVRFVADSTSGKTAHHTQLNVIIFAF
jgi:hypothetical protein